MLQTIDKPQTNGAVYGEPRHDMPVVQEPSFYIVMEGFIRLQIPASAEVQQLFMLAPRSVKKSPEKHAAVAEEAVKVTQQAQGMFANFLQSSPGLQVTQPMIGRSFAVVDGKLFYVFQLNVKTK